MSKIFEWSVALFPVLVGLAIVAVTCWVLGIAEPRRQDRMEKAISDFKRVHNCAPHGYISSKRGPIRTYLCDGVAYIERDMQ